MAAPPVGAHPELARVEEGLKPAVNSSSPAPVRRRPKGDGGSEANRGAETAYLFRHALLREVAYRLQLPGDRARAHARALAAMEELSGGRPREESLARPMVPHATDAFAAELAEHAKRAGAPAGTEALYLRRAALLLSRRFQYAPALDLWLRYEELVDGAERGRALLRGASAARHLGRAPLAEALYDRGLVILRAAGEARAEALAHVERNGLLRDAGRLDEAERAADEALAIFDRLGDAAGTVDALQARSSVEEVRGRPAQAEALLRRALSLARRSARHRVGGVLEHLAPLARQQGRPDEAGRIYDEILALAHGDASQKESLYANLGIHYQQTGRLAEAEEAYRRALALAREMGRRTGECVTLGNLGSLYSVTGRLDLAESALLQAVEAAREVNHLRAEGTSLTNLAIVSWKRSRPDACERALERVLEIHRQGGHRSYEGHALGNLADVYRDTGRLDKADRFYADALAIDREVDDPRFEAFHRCGLAALRVLQGRLPEARRLWDEGRAHLERIGDTSTLAEKREELRMACEKAGVAPLEEGSA